MEKHVSAAVKPVAPYVGGKFRLAKTIIRHINAIEHLCYAEPFVGMGGVFLRRTQSAKCEVINDYNREVATFFRVLPRHYVPFLEMMRFQITTRAEFIRLTNTRPDTLTDLERAARFLYLQKTAFGGKPGGQTFGVHKTQPARFDITKLAPMLEDLHSRLSAVTIECLHYDSFLRCYDTDKTLFYLDPPYYGCEDYYGKGMFTRDDLVLIADSVSAINGAFIMSINDVPQIREIYDRFHIKQVDTNYTIKAGAQKKVSELLISNRPFI